MYLSCAFNIVHLAGLAVDDIRVEEDVLEQGVVRMSSSILEAHLRYSLLKSTSLCVDSIANFQVQSLLRKSAS